LSWDRTITDQPHPLIERILDRVKAAYYPAVIKCANMPAEPLNIPFVYTPMHGVGLPYMTEIASRLGLLSSMVVVSEQVTFSPFPIVRTRA
jgi:phosphoglucomutase